ncbi:hypothetical protein [Epilithonimonas caeni]|uniref:hypothetical protein n=1 Tax=Epilithonimonas caeni TaxID=365343 RepID=UPI00047F4B91|nr:hypothetical protein [Epilithonimonas caeni]
MKKNGCLKIFIILFSIIIIWYLYKRHQVSKHNERVRIEDAELMKDAPDINEKLKTEKFEVLELDLNPQIMLRNINVLLKVKVNNKEEAKKIFDEIRGFYTGFKCNINLYDNRDALYKGFEYPLEGENKKFVAKHLIASSFFDSSETVMMFPYKD